MPRRRLSSFSIASALLILLLSLLGAVYVFAPAGSGETSERASMQYHTGSAIIRFRDDTIMTSPSPILNPANSGSSSQLNVNLASTLSGLSNNQLRFYVWNTSSGELGRVRLILNVTSATNPTYVLNLQNYTYSSSVISGYSQLSNQSVTFDFSIFGTGTTGVKIHTATVPITSASWDENSKTLTFAASAGTFTVATPFGQPSEVKKDGVGILTEWSYSANVVTVTASSGATWTVVWGAIQEGGGGGGTVFPSSFTLTLGSPLQIQMEPNRTETVVVPVNFEGANAITLVGASVNASWVRLLRLQVAGEDRPFLVFQSGTVSTETHRFATASRSMELVFEVNTFGVHAGAYKVGYDLEFRSDTGIRLMKNGLLQITVGAPLMGAPLGFMLPENWWLYAVGVVALVVLWQRRKPRSGH